MKNFIKIEAQCFGQHTEANGQGEERETCLSTWQTSTEAEAEKSWFSAGSARGCRLLADPELLEVTFGVVPAIPSEFHTVFFPNIVGLPSIPILLESGESVNKTLVCSRGMLRTTFLAS